MSQPGHTEAAPDPPSSTRRAIHIVAAVLVGVVLPVALVDTLVGRFAANALFLALFLGVLGSMIGGTRRMVYLAVPFVVAGGLGAFTVYDWWWVGLLTLLGVVAGAGIRWGWLPPLLMLPFIATFASRSRRDDTHWPTASMPGSACSTASYGGSALFPSDIVEAKNRTFSFSVGYRFN